MAHEPKIADYLWTDGSGFETHARLEHCCSDPFACKAAGGKPAKFLERAHEDLVKEKRHEETAQPETATLNADNLIGALPAPATPGRHRKRRRPYRYFEIGGPLPNAGS